MKRLPLHDASVPIACTASGEEVSARLAQVERLRAHLTRIERTDVGLLLHFPEGPEVRRELSSFTVDEQACCAFWGFAITIDGDEVVLRWDGPPATSGLFDRLAAHLEGDRPLTSFDGLL